MKRNSILFTTVCTGLLLFSCKHEALESSTGNGNPTNPDSTQQPPPVPACSADTVYFTQQVLPVLVSNCSVTGCHDAATRRDGVILTTYENIITTGDIEPGSAEESRLYKKITEHDNDKRMPPPPRNRLSQQQIDAIYTWIQQGAKNNACQNSCDATAVTYNSTIKGILTGKCQGCHSGTTPAATINLSTYAGVKAVADNGRLWGSINHAQGFSPMPKNGNKLSDCELKQIHIWLNAGAPNN